MQSNLASSVKKGAKGKGQSPSTQHLAPNTLSGVFLPLTLGQIGNGSPVARLFLVPLDFLGYRIHRTADQAIVILPAPLSGIDGQVRRALKTGEDFLGKQFIG